MSTSEKILITRQTMGAGFMNDSFLRVLDDVEGRIWSLEESLESLEEKYTEDSKADVRIIESALNQCRLKVRLIQNTIETTRLLTDHGHALTVCDKIEEILKGEQNG